MAACRRKVPRPPCHERAGPRTLPWPPDPGEHRQKGRSIKECCSLLTYGQGKTVSSGNKGHFSVLNVRYVPWTCPLSFLYNYGSSVHFQKGPPLRAISHDSFQHRKPRGGGCLFFLQLRRLFRQGPLPFLLRPEAAAFPFLQAPVHRHEKDPARAFPFDGGQHHISGRGHPLPPAELPQEKRQPFFQEEVCLQCPRRKCPKGLGPPPPGRLKEESICAVWP